MNIVLLVILILCAFILGACPFAVCVGQFALHKDIRKYGDGNPGSTNVFRAGGKKWGIVVLVADITKGIPFILMAKFVFGLAQPALYFIAFAAIMGHAYSPFLGFRGGKALATFGGTLLGLQQWDVIVYMLIILIIGFLLLGNDSWTVMTAITGTLIAVMVARSDLWEIIFIAGVTTLFLVKHYYDIKAHNTPSRLMVWIRSKRKAM